MPRRPLQNATFAMTGPRIAAARLVAEDELTDQQIADQFGIHRATLETWKRAPEFRERVEHFTKQVGDKVLRYAVARKCKRLQAQQDRWERMHQVIAERAEAEVMQGVPGGGTGLLTHTLKSIGGGDNARVVDEYTVDTGLLKEIRELEKQAAQEVGDMGGDESREPAQIVIMFPRADGEAMTPRVIEAIEPPGSIDETPTIHVIGNGHAEDS